MNIQLTHLETLYSENKQREKDKLALIEDPIKRPYHVLAFKGINSIFFLHKAFFEKDVQVSKEFLYKVAMTNSYYHEKLNGEIFNVLDTFTYPILCDNNKIISRYSHYKRTEHPDSFSTYFGLSIQSILNDNSQMLQENIVGLKRSSKSGWAKQFIGIIKTLEGFLNKNIFEIEEGLHQILALHHKQSQPPIIKDYINLEGTTLAKLAWRAGMKTSIESNLIPLELLPTKELPSYESYDFFNELKL